MTTPVCVQQRIRQLDRQGLSHKEISRRLGVSRTTVVKYANHGDYSPRPSNTARPGRSLVDDGYAAIVDGWLTADLRMPVKQRHTATRIWNRLIDEHATPEGKAMLARLEKMTTVHAVLRLVGKDMGTLVDCPLEQLLDSPEVQHVFADIKLGGTAPTPPVLIVQAVHDRIVSVDDIDELTEAYAAGGSHVTYHRDMFSEHLLLHPMSAPMTLRWLIDRFEGRPLSEHTARTKWPTLLNPLTYRGMWRLGSVAARVVSGRVLNRRPL